jgi:hypothetical protein
LKPLINQNAAKIILPMRKATFIAFSFQEHWMPTIRGGYPTSR